jgi:hypothetical protein
MKRVNINRVVDMKYVRAVKEKPRRDDPTGARGVLKLNG